MSNYPSSPPPPPSGPYQPQNPYSYDPNYDYSSWMPGRQGPDFKWIVAIVAAALICGCCGMLAGIIIGIELPGIIQPSAPPAVSPNLEPTPESFHFLLMLIGSALSNLHILF